MPKLLKLGFACAVGFALLALWWHHHGSAWRGVSLVHPGWLPWAVLALVSSLCIQWIRTALLVGRGVWQPIVSPVMLSHGVNVLAPSVLGDLLEISLLHRALGRPARALLARLLFRFGTTVSALGVLTGVAVASVDPSVGFAIAATAACAPYALDATTAAWSARLAIPGTQAIEPMAGIGWRQTSAHSALALVQHALSAASVFLLGAALDDAVSPAIAAGMLALADFATYLPVPLAGIGLHHWSVSTIAQIGGSVPTALVVANHGLIVSIGIAAAALGWWFGADKLPPTLHND